MIDTLLLQVDPNASLASVVGATAGFFGVAMAIYLQLLVPQRCPPEYVMLFFGIGSGMIAANYGFFGIDLYGYGDLLPVIGNLAILGAEVYLFNWVAKQADAPCIRDFLARLKPKTR